VYTPRIQSSQAAGQGTHVASREGSTTLNDAIFVTPVSNYSEQLVSQYITTPSAGLHTYKGSMQQDAAGTVQVTCSTTSFAYILVELL
jgi:hypothetical protein